MKNKIKSYKEKQPNRLIYLFIENSPFSFSLAVATLVAAISSLITALLIHPVPVVLNFNMTRSELVLQALQPLKVFILLVFSILLQFSFPKNRLKLKSNLSKKPPAYLSFFISSIVIVTALLLFISEPSRFLQRESYLSVDEHLGKVTIFQMAAKSLLGISGILCGIAYGSKINPADKTFSILAFVITALLLFSGGGKSISFHLPLFFIAWTCTSSKPKIENKWKIIFSIIWFLIFYQLALANRQSLTHGIIPYFHNLFDKEFYEKFGDFRNLVGFLLFGSAVRVASIDYLSHGTVPISVALNPLSGQASGWNSIAEELRIAYFIPTPGLGELNAMSLGNQIIFFIWLALLSFIVDTSLNKISNLPRWLSGPIRAAVYMITIGWIQLLCIYNLRSSCRMLYYSIFICIVGVALHYVSLLIISNKPLKLKK